MPRPGRHPGGKPAVKALRILRNRYGTGNLILAVCLAFSAGIAAVAWAVVSQVQATQTLAERGLAYALRMAAVDGTTVLPDGSFAVGEAQALMAAQGAIPLVMPLSLDADTPDGATYAPTSAAPAGWGTVTLSGFAVGNPTQPANAAVCYGGSAPLSSCPYVVASLTLPYKVDLWGADLSLSYTVTETQIIDTADSTGTFR